MGSRFRRKATYHSSPAELKGNDALYCGSPGGPRLSRDLRRGVSEERKGRAWLDTTKAALRLTRHQPAPSVGAVHVPSCGRVPPTACRQGSLRSRQRHHWGRWRGTWLQASCVSNAGSSVRVQPPLSLPITVARASPKRLAWKVLSSRTFHDRRGGDAWNERVHYQCGLRGGWAALVAG
jgi:hypothetical protein